MTKEKPKNMAASAHDRLLLRSRETIEDFQFLLQRYAAERFLYRLGKSSHREGYVLKGAMLFALWSSSIYRATRDLDFTVYGSSGVDVVRATIEEVCAVAVEDDGLIFDMSGLTIEPIRDETEYGGLRARFPMRLGSTRIPMQIDIGFGNAIVPAPTDVDYPTLLGMERPRIRAYPHEAVIAEKFHAMVVNGDRNSRLKDFYDLYVMATQFVFAGKEVKQAIEATFERRRTAMKIDLPLALTPRFYNDTVRAQQWRMYLARNNVSGTPMELGAVGEVMQSFLIPVWDSIVGEYPFEKEWKAGEGWK